VGGEVNAVVGTAAQLTMVICICCLVLWFWCLLSMTVSHFRNMNSQ